MGAITQLDFPGQGSNHSWILPRHGSNHKTRFYQLYFTTSWEQSHSWILPASHLVGAITQLDFTTSWEQSQLDFTTSWEQSHS